MTPDLRKAVSIALKRGFKAQVIQKIKTEEGRGFVFYATRIDAEKDNSTTNNIDNNTWQTRDQREEEEIVVRESQV